MDFKVGSGVRKLTPDGIARKYIGMSGRQANFKMGRWKFNNCISATVFEYIVSKGDLSYAEEATVRLERLIKVPALRNYSGLSIFDCAEAIPHPTAQAIGRIGNGINKAAKGIGEFIAGQNVKTCGGFNIFSAAETNKYVDFALAYWTLNPKSGPAYKYISDNPSVKRRKGVPEFDPFNWGGN